MERKSHQQRRQSIRWKGYDYAQAGAYFVTIVTSERKNVFGEVKDGTMRLNQAGSAVEQLWLGIPRRFDNVELDGFVIMPNHIHGIVILTNAKKVAQNTASTTSEAHESTAGLGNEATTLGEVIRAFKAVTTRQVRLSGFARFGWQRNYHDRVIRNEKELSSIRQYIADNPANWELDRENTAL